MRLIVCWADGREEQRDCSPGDTVEVGEGEMQDILPLYRGGPVLVRVRLRGDEIPSLVCEE